LAMTKLGTRNGRLEYHLSRRYCRYREKQHYSKKNGFTGHVLFLFSRLGRLP
jgi:hypothetical protein